MEDLDLVYEPNYYCAVDNTSCNGACRKRNGKNCHEKISEKDALGKKAYNKKHGIKPQRRDF